MSNQTAATTQPTQPSGTGQSPQAPGSMTAPAASPQSQTPGQGGAQSATLTPEQLDAKLKEVEENAFRRAQSYFDKAQGKVREQIQALEGAWAIQAAAGNPVDEATKSQIKNKLAMDAMTENVLSQPGQQASPQNAGQSVSGQAQQPGYDPVLQIVLGMQQEAGMEILDNDPEVQMLDQTNPHTLIKSLQKAIDAKKARTSTNPTQTPSTTPSVPGMTSGVPGDPREGKSGYELISSHFEKS